MSFEDGWAAIHLQMPARVPRTEYSADFHWDLVRAVTGIEVGPHSPVDATKPGQHRFHARLELRLRMEHPGEQG